MITFTDKADLTVPPLSKAEKEWIRRLQKVLSECPDRLELMTSGDPSLIVVDADGAKRSELCDGAAYRDGVALSLISGKPTVHGVSS